VQERNTREKYKRGIKDERCGKEGESGESDAKLI
jgi:hypothetical protein